MPSFIVYLLFMLSLGKCHADSNEHTGWQCSDTSDLLLEGSFKTNRDDLLNLLTQNGPLRNGFFKMTVGKGSEKFYGLVQCRADVSVENCANCTREAVAVALHDCKKDRDVTVWLTWCFLRYSTQNFFGVWEKFGETTVSGADTDNSTVVLNGLNFMSEVATRAVNRYLMFNAGVLNVGRFGKRYGLAQCRRDISTSNCSKCFEDHLETFKSTIEDKRNWEVYGASCSMWYHDHLFYFNISNIPAIAKNGARTFIRHGVAVGITMAVLVFLIVS